MGKILRLRQKITSIKDSVTGFFSKGTEKDPSSAKLDAFKGKWNQWVCVGGAWATPVVLQGGQDSPRGWVAVVLLVTPPSIFSSTF